MPENTHALHAYGVPEQMDEGRIGGVRLRICKTLPLNQSAASSCRHELSLCLSVCLSVCLSLSLSVSLSLSLSLSDENDTCQPATVVDKSAEPRSYIVRMHGDGRLLRRNRRHLQELYNPQRQTSINTPIQETSWDDITPPSQQHADPLEVSTPSNNNGYTATDNPGQPVESNQQPELLTKDRPKRARRAPQKYKDFTLHSSFSLLR
ncbi:unnamed protein product [Acanthosepion pharaonis]|uniref:Uncharacterized protein n=1 Tax=Acanthosepion pharaonis TaxID=158019 RepID=A0A812ELY9_ACAPH|nr:unnamed protein product [Sepia pharaonis]